MDWDGRVWVIRRTYLTFDISTGSVASATLEFDWMVTHIHSDRSTMIYIYKVDYGPTLETNDWDALGPLVAQQQWNGNSLMPAGATGHVSIDLPNTIFTGNQIRLIIKTAEDKPFGWNGPGAWGYDAPGFGTDLRLSDIKLDIAPISTPTPTTTTTPVPTPTPTSPVLPTGSGNKQAIQIVGAVLTCLGLLLVVKRR